MTKFNQRRFSVSAPITDAYAANYERTFGKKSSELDAAFDSMVDMPSSVIDMPVGLPKIVVARVEIEKWIQRLEEVASSPYVIGPSTHERLRTVTESMKLILKADRITDALARK